MELSGHIQRWAAPCQLDYYSSLVSSAAISISVVRPSNNLTASCACLQHYKPPDEKPSEYQTIPLSKIEDFGVHANSYYSLDISYFKSSLDAGLLDQLWGKYWVNTLASSPLLATRDLTAGQMRDIGVIPDLPQPETVLPDCALVMPLNV